MKLLVVYAAGWLGLVLLAIINGALREKGYGRHMSALSAHQLSTAIGLVLFGGYIWCFSGLFLPASAAQAVTIGLMWLVMTIVFEFVFGHYVMGHAWRVLLQDYNLFRGRVWVLVLVWTAVAPYLFYCLRR